MPARSCVLRLLLSALATAYTAAEECEAEGSTEAFTVGGDSSSATAGCALELAAVREELADVRRQQLAEEVIRARQAMNECRVPAEWTAGEPRRPASSSSAASNAAISFASLVSAVFALFAAF